MNQKFALTLAASITAFVLVIGGAMIGRAAQPEAAVTLTPDVAEIQAVYEQREAEYQARLAEANAALSAAYAATRNRRPKQYSSSIRNRGSGRGSGASHHLTPRCGIGSGCRSTQGETAPKTRTGQLPGYGSLRNHVRCGCNVRGR